MSTPAMNENAVALQGGDADASLKAGSRVNFDLSYPDGMQEVDEFLDEGEGEESRYQQIMRLLMEPPLPKPIALGKIVEDGFGFYRKINFLMLDDKPTAIMEDVVKRYTMMNHNNVIVQVINYGATIVNISYPDKNGKVADVVMGFDNLDGYMSRQNPKFGAVLGRYSSIISEGHVKIGSDECYLSQNQGEDHVCGGVVGFDKVLWHSYVDRDRVVMTYTSKDKEEGYPGNLMAQIVFRLTSTDQLIVETSATSSKPSPVSLGHNVFFNLAGHAMGKSAIRQHVIMVNADRWFLTNPETGKLTGETQNVGATYFDLRVPRPVGKALDRVPGNGYDTNFALTKGLVKKAVTFAARLVHPESGRFLEIMTDMPSLHVTTGNHLPDPDMPWGGYGPFKADEGEEDKLAFLCRDKTEEGDWMWPTKMLSTTTWPRPASIPEEEHIFKRFSDLSLAEKTSARSDKSSEVEEKGLNLTQSMLVRAGTLLGDSVLAAEEGVLDNEEEEDEEEMPTWIPPKAIEGKEGAQYKFCGGVSFTTEEYPEPFKYKRHPRPIVYPGQKYVRTTIYKLGCVPLRNTEDKAQILSQIV